MSTLTKDGDVVTLKTGTAINAQNAEGLKVQLRQVVEEGARRIVFDLAETDVIDSIGLGLLVATHNSLSRQGSKLELINAREKVCKVLFLMRLDRYFSISCARD